LRQHGLYPLVLHRLLSLGRTGMDFMDLAKPGEIKSHCDPNALSRSRIPTDYASPATRTEGERLIQTILQRMAPCAAACRESSPDVVRQGRRDVLV